MSYLHRTLMLLLVAYIGIGQMWGETVLKTIDFSDAEWAGTTFSQGNTDTYDVHNGVTFHSKNASNHFSYSSNKLTFPGSNPSTSNYFLAFPIENIVDGRIIIRAYNGTSQVMVQYAVSDGRTEFSSSAPSFTTTIQGAPTAVCVTGLSNANKKAYVYIGRGSSSYTQITKIEVLTGGTTLTESAFYQTYGTSSKTAYEFMALAEFPSYLIPTNAGSISTQNNSGITVPEISSPHNFAGLSTSTTYYRIKNANNNTYTLYNVANLKSVRFYGNGDGGTPTITTTVTKVSGSGSSFSVSTISTPTNNSKLIGEHTTGDLTSKSGYSADTYYDYTFKFTANFDLWGIYVEAGSAAGCPYYSFHTGGDDVQTNNTQSCFVNYTSTEE